MTEHENVLNSYNMFKEKCGKFTAYKENTVLKYRVFSFATMAAIVLNVDKGYCITFLQGTENYRIATVSSDSNADTKRDSDEFVKWLETFYNLKSSLNMTDAEKFLSKNS